MMKKGCMLLFSFIHLLFTAASIAGIEDRSFERQRLELVSKIEKILIEGGVCKDKADCQKKKLVYVSPGKSGINIQIYSINYPVILKKIVAECSGYFFEFDGAMNIDIEVFGFNKDDDVSRAFWHSRKSNMEVKFNRE